MCFSRKIMKNSVKIVLILVGFNLKQHLRARFKIGAWIRAIFLNYVFLTPAVHSRF